MDTTAISQLWTTIQQMAVMYGLKFLLAILIFVVGRLVIKVLVGGLKKFFSKRKFDATLTSFGLNIISGLLTAFVVIAALGELGVQTSSFVAIIGAAGLAVGFALQGSLASFAAGVLIIVLHPFKIGDFISAGGSDGTVSDIGIFTTSLTTIDNKTVVIPNTEIMGSTITNYTAKKTRRIDLVIGIGYDDNIRKVEGVLKSVLNKTPGILADPPYTIGVLELADSSVNFAVRPWVATSDYWPVYFDLMRAIKLALDENGINIPYPQRDVHLHYVAPKDADENIPENGTIRVSEKDTDETA